MNRAVIPLVVFVGAAVLFGLTLGRGGGKLPPKPVAEPAPFAEPASAADPAPVAVVPVAREFSMATLPHGESSMAEAIRAEVANAARLGRRPFVYFYAEWCGPCRDLRDSMDDPRMVDAFAGTHIIKVDVDEWEDEIDEDYEVQYIPLIFELGGDGRPTGRTITSTAWDDNIPENMAPPLKAFFRAGSTSI